MKKFDFGRIFDNKNFRKVFSLALAVLAWLVVVSSIDKTKSEEIKNVPVNITQTEREVLLPLNLSIVDGRDITVTVAVEGDRSVVGGVTASDVDIRADLSGITGTGTYEVALYGNKTLNYNSGDRYGKGFRLRSDNPINPPTVEVTVARLTSKKFPIQADIDGLRVPEDYVGQDTVLSPKEVTITGPEPEINKIDRCVVSAEFTEPLTGNRTLSKREIVLYDAEGNELDKSLLTLDSETADITVPVLKKKELPLSFDYIKVPSGFPIDRIEDKLSAATILVAGPANIVDSYESLDLGFINFTEVTLDNFIFTFDVDDAIPAGCINLSDVHSVSVEVDVSDMLEATFTIPGENIRTKKVPVNYTVTVETPSISGVHVIGDQTVLEALSGSDLIAEIDLSEKDVSPGPYSWPVHISAPGKGLVWATGDYTAVVTIRER